MNIGVYNSIGLFAVIVLICTVGVLSGRNIKNASDFMTGGGRSGQWLVCGGIMGALVSSQATVGTAQLAFHYGMSAWWFTLGSGIGCLVLALGYAVPLRKSGCATVLQVISKEYGHKAEFASSILSSLGIFISVLCQVVACVGLVTVLLPVSIPVGALISIAIMAVYVVFGGAWGAGTGGVLKLVLLYGSCILGVLVVLYLIDVGDLFRHLQGLLGGTPLGAQAGLETAEDVSFRFGSLVSRGAQQDIGSGVSLTLGVLSTQTYAQAIWTGKSDRAAKRGSLLAAFLIPPIGLAGILVGLFMRLHYLTQAEADALLAAGHQIPEGMQTIASTVQVFPVFVVNHMPVLLAGIVLGTLLLSVVGGGAGLSLGVATILVNDIYKRISKAFERTKVSLVASRLTILAVLMVSAVIACAVPSATINDFGYLSMGLRGAVVFVPLTAALFLPKKIDSRYILAAIVTGPCGVLGGKLAGVSFDPLFIGMALSLACGVMGYAAYKQKKTRLFEREKRSLV